MKTLNNFFRNALLITVITISALTLNAQNDTEIGSAIVQLDTVSVNNNHYSFEKMTSDIATSTDFKYRKALRKAKGTGNFGAATKTKQPGKSQTGKSGCCPDNDE